MDRQKQINLIRKRNAGLAEKLDRLQFQLDYDAQLNREGYRHAKDLISQLTQIKADWLNALADLEKQKEQYAGLIQEIRKLKKEMQKRR